MEAGGASEARAGREAGLVYLSSSGATSSTKILGLGGVLRGKVLEDLKEGQKGWRRIIPRRAHQESLLVMVGTVTGVKLRIIFRF